MANIRVVGKMETAVTLSKTPHLYLTVRDYSNPDPTGGLVLDVAATDKQSFAFVTAPNFPQDQMMLVTYPRIDYKLRMSDRVSTSSGTRERRIIETIKTNSGEIAQGKPITPPPSPDYLWRVENKDENVIIFSASDGRAVDIHVAPEQVKPGVEVSGFTKHNRIDQQWNLENPL